MFLDLNKLIELQKEISVKVEETKRNLAQKVFVGTAGGSLVEVFITGNLEVTKIIISESVLNPPEKEFLEVLLTSSINDALNKVQEAQSNELSKVLSSFGNVGGINLNPFIKS